MNVDSRPVPAWLKWLSRLFGAVLVLGSLFLTALWAIAVIGVFHIFLGPKGHDISDNQWAGIFGGLLGRLVGQVLVLMLGVWLWRWPGKKSMKSTEEAKLSQPSLAPVVAPIPAAFPTQTKSKRWSACNILHIAPEANRLWQFDARGRGFVLGREQKAAEGAPLPSRLVGKSWSSLWQPRLNVAWLPPEEVFLRVVELPKSNFDETRSMIELQLEKLSPSRSHRSSGPSIF